MEHVIQVESTITVYELIREMLVQVQRYYVCVADEGGDKEGKSQDVSVSYS
jgi:hypothetical protein